MDKRILFVDDEMSILRSIKRVFFNKGYTLYLGNSAKEGLEILKTTDIDIVVSDVKMPEMDGITFLKEVKRLYPNVDRIILSGFVEKDAVLKAIITGIAFDYITKPWDNEVLFDKLKTILFMREKLSSNALITLLNSIETLPKIPEISVEFNNAVESNKSFHEIAQIVEKDIAISSKVLQLVNSAFYARTKVGSVDQAVAIIGFNGIKNIILYSSLIEGATLNKQQKEILAKYDDRAYKTNKLFVKFYELYTGQKTPTDYEMLGLALYVGKVIVLCYFWERYKKVIEQMKKDKEMSFWEAEMNLEYTDLTHIEIGAYFLNLWNFPMLYFQVIFNYMTPDTAPENIREIINVLNIAKKYANNSTDEEIQEILFTKNKDANIKEILDEYKK